LYRISLGYGRPISASSRRRSRGTRYGLELSIRVGKLSTRQVLSTVSACRTVLESAAFESQEETTRKLLKAVEEFSTYIERNGGFIPNYGERYRNGERISTGIVESAINQVVSKRMAKKQQMQWTQRGAHLLLQVRTRVLNEEWEDVFRRWYPDFRQQQSMKAAA
jgi:hypothetical protein